MSFAAVLVALAFFQVRKGLLKLPQPPLWSIASIDQKIDTKALDEILHKE